MLALEARNSGEQTTAEVIARYEEVTQLDPGVHWDWVELGRLYVASGNLSAAEQAAHRATETAKDERDSSVAQSELADMRVAQGDLTGALESYGEAMMIFRAPRRS